MTTQYSTAHRTNRASTLNTDIGANAVLTLYSGTPPANVAAALSGNTALSTHACSATYGSAASGALTANAIGSATAVAGTVTFYRIATSGGTVVVQGSVSDLTIAGGNTFTAGQTVTISSLVHTMAGA